MIRKWIMRCHTEIDVFEPRTTFLKKNTNKKEISGKIITYQDILIEVNCSEQSGRRPLSIPEGSAKKSSLCSFVFSGYIIFFGTGGL